MYSAEFPEVSTVSKGLALELFQIQKSAAASRSQYSEYTQWMESLFQSKCVNAKKLKIKIDPACKPEVLQLLHEPFSLPVRQQSHTSPEPSFSEKEQNSSTAHSSTSSLQSKERLGIRA